MPLSRKSKESVNSRPVQSVMPPIYQSSPFFLAVNCGSGVYIVSRNPARSEVTAALAESSSQQDNTAVITEVNIYDQRGNLKKHQKFSKVKRAPLNVADLRAGVYFIEIVNGTYKECQQLSILKQ